ncbi:hypothetical protein NHX12_023757 [Muraenolepis orangiensis]|uniref:Transmembrane protein 196 n=1 Tax=Muraenolepis orangiensis TaxID=630683 RepID=A0A9Q0EMS9_9TELE|nr:hypothetical protein NHX12_023757 [Muraenolepis orangiensis]
MCSSRTVLWSLLLLSAVEAGLGVASMALGAVGLSGMRADAKPQQGDASPVWSGLCFLLCGGCGLLCARRRTGLIVSKHRGSIPHLMDCFGLQIGKEH